MVNNKERSSTKTTAKPKTVYFGCSMVGGYTFVTREELTEFPKLITELGCRLASDHQTQPGVIEREAKLDPTFIHDRDYLWALESDLGIFEISNPSLGVGGEISDMIYMGKPVLLLFKGGLEERISAYMRGKMGSAYVKSPVECRAYEDIDDAGKIIRGFLSSHNSQK